MRLEDLQGRRFGRYEIISVLGRGGMAAVYRAHDTVLRRDVALKVLYPQYISDGALMERFQREAVLAAGLDHPNIVPIYDVGEADGLAYIAMKLLSGRSLDDVLRMRGKLPLRELVPIVEQIAAALDYAHARGIVHRDIKAGNILLEGLGTSVAQGAGWDWGLGTPAPGPRSPVPSPRAMLTDFGIAKSLDAPGMTGTGVLLGTPDYMAPEQIRGAQVVDGRADIYALGVLVFRCLTGRRPFEGGTDEVLLGHLQGRAADPSLIEPSLPNAVDLVIHKAMARRPADRYSTAGAFAQALGAAAGMDQPTPPPARRRDVEGRVVVPRVAVEGLTRQQANMDAVTRKGAAAPPGARPTPAVAVTPLQRSRSRGGAGGFMVAALLVLLVGGGGLLLAQSVQRNDGDSGGVVAVATPEPTTAAPEPTQAPPEPTPPPEPTQAPSPEPTQAPTQMPPTQAPPTTTTTPRPTRTAPTATPTPTRTPAPEPSKTPTPTPCPTTPVSGFGKLWNETSPVRDKLGCALAAEQPGQIAEQPFEHGSMFWFQPQENIYVLEGKDRGTWSVFEQSSLLDRPTPEPVKPPPGLVAPINGFGLVWNNVPEVRDALGWGTAPEAGPYSGAYESFENGIMLFSPQGLGRGKTIYVLYKDGSFTRYDDTFVDPKR